MQPRTFEVDLPMLRLTVLVFAAWGLLSGCTGPTYNYSKGGADVADFRQASYACVQEPRMSWGASGSPTSVGASRIDDRREAKLYRMCMEANGWTAEAPR
jgi:hypothetical protein